MLRPGDIIGSRYEILELLGSGGMAYVYKAKCHKLNRFVAIKILKPEYRTDAVFLQKFQVEAQAAAALSHPNIVNIYDVGEEEDLFYIVMEFVDGITLKEYIQQKGRILPKETVEIALYIAAGIQAAHGQNIIHRDIKPQNILVGRNGDVKVTDFGIAKAVSTNTMTATNIAVGSVHYISPEQAKGSYCDGRSDIYSLGVTMYEMVTGRVPFDGESNVAIALAHVQKEAIPVSEYYNDIPKSLEKMIIKAMQKRPERRYQTVQQLILDLKRVFSNPDGEYISIMPTISDSPTIMMSDEERERIKEGAKEQVTEHTVSFQQVEEKNKSSFQNYQPKQEAKSDKDIKEDLREEEAAQEEELYDPDEKDGMDPKLEKLVFILGIVAAVLVAIFVIFMIGKGLDLFGTRPQKGGNDSSQTTFFVTEDAQTSEATTETTQDTEATTEEQGVTMVNVVGKTLDEAKREIEALGLSFGEPNYVTSDTYEEGYVVEQDVRVGEQVLKGTKIHLTVSQGAKQITVPNFIGETKESAQELASQSELKISFRSAYSDEVSEGEIFEQSVSYGTKVKAGTTISVTVSLGKEEVKVKVQDFTGMSKTDAQDLAKQFGLVLRPVEQYSDYTEGLVYDQDIEQGTEVEEGTVITVYISKGKEPIVEYSGSVTITEGSNPFMEGEKGYVTVVAEQDGDEKIIFQGTLSYKDFPKTITFKSSSSEDAYIHMIVDGEQTEDSWVVSME